MVLSKLKVVEYFDSVINEIDLFTEKEIVACIDNERIELVERERVEQLLNERRQAMLSKVNEIQQHCLRQIEQLTIQDETNKKSSNDDDDYTINEKVFSKFCFTIMNSNLVFLIALDYYVSSREIERFKAWLLAFTSKDQSQRDEQYQLRLEILDPRLRLKEATNDKWRDTVRVSSLEAYEILENDDSPVIHVTKPFKLECVSISEPIKVDDDCMMMNSRPRQTTENKLVRADRLLNINIKNVSECLDSLECLVNLHVRLDHIRIIGATGFEKEEFDRLVSLLSRGKELFKRVSLSEVRISGETCCWNKLQKVDFIQELRLEFGAECSIGSRVFEWLSNWSQLQSLSLRWLRDSGTEKLSREHFSCLSNTLKRLDLSLPAPIDPDALMDLHSLRSLHLATYDKKINDWSFLDSVRDRLETLTVKPLGSVSGALFRDMPKLKSLVILSYDTSKQLDYDLDEENREELLFTGLESLERLNIQGMSSKFNNPRHFAHLTSLQHLGLDCSQACFPLTLFSQTSQDPLSFTTHPHLFSNLRTLEIYFTSFGDFCPRPFSRLTNLTSLELTCKESRRCEISVTRDLFYGLDSLQDLILTKDYRLSDRTRQNYKIEPNAFAHLHQLQNLRLTFSEKSFKELNEKGAFAKCKSIKHITVGDCCFRNWKTVYLNLNKLDRFVMVVKLYSY